MAVVIRVGLPRHINGEQDVLLRRVLSVIQAHLAILPIGEVKQRAKRVGHELAFVVARPSNALRLVKALQLAIRRLRFSAGFGLGAFYEDQIAIADVEIEPECLMRARSAAKRAGRVRNTRVLFAGTKQDKIYSAAYGVIFGARFNLSPKAHKMALACERSATVADAIKVVGIYAPGGYRVIHNSLWLEIDLLDALLQGKLDLEQFD